MAINPQSEYDTQELFRNELLRDETIKWVGQPDPSIIFDSADFFIIPFSLLWGGFAFFWEATALKFVFKSGANNNPPDIFSILFGVPFVLVGIYMIIGRFFHKAWKKKRTYYAVTDKRLLILINQKNRNLEAHFIRNIPTINKSVGRSGAGTIIFGNTSFSAMFASSGFGTTGQVPFPPAFYDIHDVNTVYELVNRLRNEPENNGY